MKGKKCTKTGLWMVQLDPSNNPTQQPTTTASTYPAYNTQAESPIPHNIMYLPTYQTLQNPYVRPSIPRSTARAITKCSSTSNASRTNSSHIPNSNTYCYQLATNNNPSKSKYNRALSPNPSNVQHGHYTEHKQQRGNCKIPPPIDRFTATILNPASTHKSP